MGGALGASRRHRLFVARQRCLAFFGGIGRLSSCVYPSLRRLLRTVALHRQCSGREIATGSQASCSWLDPAARRGAFETVFSSKGSSFGLMKLLTAAM